MEIRLIASCNPLATGWHVRLAALNKGYRVTQQPLPFGRTGVVVKRNGVGLFLKQGADNTVKTVVDNPSAAQMEILEDLRSIGMLCADRGASP